MGEMPREDFVATVKIRGLATADTAREYAKGKITFNETDLEEVYRKQMAIDKWREPGKWRNYQGVRCTKRLKEPESHREY